jgi:hypothetical protein
MKELSIEEKAKRYDEALERAKMEMSKDGMKNDVIAIHLAETIFPELKGESEDERISKEIIKYLEQTVPHHHRDEVLKSKEWTAWLEKQGEKESDPRYKYLKELLASDNIYQMAMNDYMVQEAKTKAINALSELEIGKLLGIEKQGEQKPAAWSEEDDNCLLTIIAEFSKCAGKSVSKDEWMRCNDFLNSPKNKVQPKVEWSKEDEANLNEALSYIKDDALKEFIKSLRPQKQWKPSCFQIEAIESATENCAYSEYKDSLKELIKQLKNLN